MNMIFGDVDACNLYFEMQQMQALYATMQCNGKLYNAYDIFSYFCDLILIWFFCFFFFLFVENTD